ncbi:MAG TPA: Uma2 family endonuclease [Pyrinomonadaceae bacterium]|jgi:Uma2 family endonuclease
MSTTTQLMTAEDLLNMPDDGFRYELVKGELRRMSPSGYNHGKIAARLTGALIQYVEEHELGDVCAAETGFTVKTQPDTVRAPDVAFIRRERVEEVSNTKSYGRGVPDLAVEVVSPSDKAGAVEEKIQEWLESGVLLLWVISPKLHAVTVYRSSTDIKVLTENDTLDGEDVVPGFLYPVARLFAGKRQ